MRETGPTSEESATYLAGRVRKACDQHAIRRGLVWTLADITAIRQLLDDRVRELVAEQR